MHRFTAFLLLTLAVASCSDHGSVAPVTTAPTPLTPPAPPSRSVFMRGTVDDTAFRQRAGARVQVVSGPQAGLSTTTDSSGDFSFSETFDQTTQFRASHDGYATATRTLQPFCAQCNPNWWINFSLEVLAPPVNLAGDYTLTFVADSTCGGLPNELRTRSYAVTIPPASSTGSANAYFPVAVSGALEGWKIP